MFVPDLINKPVEDRPNIFHIENLISVTVRSSRDYDGEREDRLSIESYELVSYQNKTLKVQVNFKFPEYISMNKLDLDRLRVLFKETWFFIDEEER